MENVACEIDVYTREIMARIEQNEKIRFLQDRVRGLEMEKLDLTHKLEGFYFKLGKQEARNNEPDLKRESQKSEGDHDAATDVVKKDENPDDNGGGDDDQEVKNIKKRYIVAEELGEEETQACQKGLNRPEN